MSACPAPLLARPPRPLLTVPAPTGQLHRKPCQLGTMRDLLGNGAGLSGAMHQNARHGARCGCPAGSQAPSRLSLCSRLLSTAEPELPARQPRAYLRRGNHGFRHAGSCHVASRKMCGVAERTLLQHFWRPKRSIARVGIGTAHAARRSVTHHNPWQDWCGRSPPRRGRAAGIFGGLNAAAVLALASARTRSRPSAFLGWLPAER